MDAETARLQDWTETSWIVPCCLPFLDQHRWHVTYFIRAEHLGLRFKIYKNERGQICADRVEPTASWGAHLASGSGCRDGFQLHLCQNMSECVTAGLADPLYLAKYGFNRTETLVFVALLGGEPRLIASVYYFAEVAHNLFMLKVYYDS